MAPDQPFSAGHHRHSGPHASSLGQLSLSFKKHLAPLTSDIKYVIAMTQDACTPLQIFAPRGGVSPGWAFPRPCHSKGQSRDLPVWAAVWGVARGSYRGAVSSGVTPLNIKALLYRGCKTFIVSILQLKLSVQFGFFLWPFISAALNIWLTLSLLKTPSWSFLRCKHHMWS